MDELADTHAPVGEDEQSGGSQGAAGAGACSDSPPPLEPAEDPGAVDRVQSRRYRQLPDGRYNVTSDGGVVKKIVKHARADAPTPQGGGEVTIRYTARLARNGFQFDCSPPPAEGEPDEGLTVTMGRDMLITGVWVHGSVARRRGSAAVTRHVAYVPGFERGIASMAAGEVATLTVQPKYAYGEEGSPDGQVPANAVLEYHVELVSAHPRPKTLHEMTDEVRERAIDVLLKRRLLLLLSEFHVGVTCAGPQERYEVASAARQQGNAHYRSKNFAEAAAAYDKAWIHLDRIMQPSPAQRNDVRALKVTVLLNLAQTRLKLGMYRDVIQHCNAVLALDAANVKALFRRSRA